MDTKEAIINSAQKLFAAKGFKSTTVREIAKASGANIAMVYYYFETKEGLHRQIIESAFSSLSQQLTDCIDGYKNPKENLRCVIELYVNFFHKNRALHRIILREIASRPKHIEAVVKKYISKNLGMINGLLQRGVQNGEFREQDTALSTFNLIGMIIQFFNVEPIIKQFIDNGDREVSEYLPDHIFNLFMHGIESSS